MKKYFSLFILVVAFSFTGAQGEDSGKSYDNETLIEGESTRQDYKVPEQELEYDDFYLDDDYYYPDEEEPEEYDSGPPNPLAEILPQVKFDCSKVKDGYYADVQFDCKVFHYCQNKKRHTFMCPPKSWFNQLNMICDFDELANDDCESSSNYFKKHQVEETKTEYTKKKVKTNKVRHQILPPPQKATTLHPTKPTVFKTTKNEEPKKINFEPVPIKRFQFKKPSSKKELSTPAPGYKTVLHGSFEKFNLDNVYKPERHVPNSHHESDRFEHKNQAFKGSKDVYEQPKRRPTLLKDDRRPDVDYSPAKITEYKRPRRPSHEFGLPSRYNPSTRLEDVPSNRPKKVVYDQRPILRGVRDQERRKTVFRNLHRRPEFQTSQASAPKYEYEKVPTFYSVRYSEPKHHRRHKRSLDDEGIFTSGFSHRASNFFSGQNPFRPIDSNDNRNSFEPNGASSSQNFAFPEFIRTSTDDGRFPSGSERDDTRVAFQHRRNQGFGGFPDFFKNSPFEDFNKPRFNSGQTVSSGPQNTFHRPLVSSSGTISGDTNDDSSHVDSRSQRRPNRVVNEFHRPRGVNRGQGIEQQSQRPISAGIGHFPHAPRVTDDFFRSPEQRPRHPSNFDFRRPNLETHNRVRHRPTVFIAEPQLQIIPEFDHRRPPINSRPPTEFLANSQFVEPPARNRRPITVFDPHRNTRPNSLSPDSVRRPPTEFEVPTNSPFEEQTFSRDRPVKTENEELGDDKAPKEKKKVENRYKPQNGFGLEPKNKEPLQENDEPKKEVEDIAASTNGRDTIPEFGAKRIRNPGTKPRLNTRRRRPLSDRHRQRQRNNIQRPDRGHRTRLNQRPRPHKIEEGRHNGFARPDPIPRYPSDSRQKINTKRPQISTESVYDEEDKGQGKKQEEEVRQVVSGRPSKIRDNIPTIQEPSELFSRRPLNSGRIRNRPLLQSSGLRPTPPLIGFGIPEEPFHPGRPQIVERPNFNHPSEIPYQGGGDIRPVGGIRHTDLTYGGNRAPVSRQPPSQYIPTEVAPTEDKNSPSTPHVDEAINSGYYETTTEVTKGTTELPTTTKAIEVTTTKKPRRPYTRLRKRPLKRRRNRNRKVSTTTKAPETSNNESSFGHKSTTTTTEKPKTRRKIRYRSRLRRNRYKNRGRKTAKTTTTTTTTTTIAPGYSESPNYFEATKLNYKESVQESEEQKSTTTTTTTKTTRRPTKRVKNVENGGRIFNHDSNKLNSNYRDRLRQLARLRIRSRLRKKKTSTTTSTTTTTTSTTTEAPSTYPIDVKKIEQIPKEPTSTEAVRSSTDINEQTTIKELPTTLATSKRRPSSASRRLKQLRSRRQRLRLRKLRRRTTTTEAPEESSN